MFNQQLNNELDKLIRSKKVTIRYPKGYQHWKKKFHSTLRDTNGDVNKALEKIHGTSPKKNGTKT